MRQINKIIVHCSASDKPEHDHIDIIKHWHIARGWRNVGYHFFIRKNGEIQEGRPIEQIGAHTYGYNSDSIGICLSGLTNFRPAQFQALRDLVENLNATLGTLIIPTPHNKYTTNKTCPNFDLIKALHANQCTLNKFFDTELIGSNDATSFDLHEEEFV